MNVLFLNNVVYFVLYTTVGTDWRLHFKKIFSDFPVGKQRILRS
jgi:hypothetical protein